MASTSAHFTPPQLGRWFSRSGHINDFALLNSTTPICLQHLPSSPQVSSHSPSPGASTDTTDVTDPGVSPQNVEDDDDAFPDGVTLKTEEQDEPTLDDLKIEVKPINAKESTPIPFPLSLAATAPRKRGRPRKHPIAEHKKSTHARSKTGCGTCRRRKKKCDETKPVCLNCEKNNVVCDGYEPKQPWRSGRQKALVVRRASVPTSLPPIVPGVETATDEQFYVYFCNNVTKSLSMITDGYNPFQREILPMAHQSVGLMHSLLYLASSCLLAKGHEPNSQWEERHVHHRIQAASYLRKDIDKLHDADTSLAVFEPSIAQTLVLCLQTVCAGSLHGEWRMHLNAMKYLLTSGKRFPNDRLRQLVLEFLIYHDYSSAITNVENPLDDRSLALMEDFRLPSYMIQPQAGTLLGVLDRLFSFISQIRGLRDRIRQNDGQYWDGHIMEEAWRIQRELDAWRPQYPEDSPRYAPSMLYRICTFVYLQRTIKPSRPCNEIKKAVDEGLAYLRELPWDSDDISAQSILLMPLFLLGCAAFEKEQRPEIAEAFARLRDWSGFGNIRYAQVVVEDMWELMDQGRESETWAWEDLMKEKGWDFLVT